MHCPLNKTCSTQKDGKEDRCLWFIRMQNEEGHFFDVCAISLIPSIYRKLIIKEKEKHNGSK